MSQMQVSCLLLNRDKVDLDSMPQFPAGSQLDSSFTAYQNALVAVSSLIKKTPTWFMIVQQVIMQMNIYVCAIW